ncbi:MAG: redoxin family protein [Gemmataceae bacterium]
MPDLEWLRRNSRLDADYGSKGVLFYACTGQIPTSSDDAAKHAKEYGLKFPILIDHEHAVAKAVGASRTPEAVVLTPDGKVVYRGRIDNKYEQNGKRRDEPTERYLRAALDSHLAGKPVPTSETKAVGCPIHGPK